MSDSADATPRSLAPSDVGLDPALDACGLDLVGVLPIARYDALVPEAWSSRVLLPAARFAYVIGSGGPAFFRAAVTARPQSDHPLDTWCEERVKAAGERLGAPHRALFYWEKRGAGEGDFADFVAIAHEAGLGARSRIGLLLHPEHGPWFGIRAVLLTAREPSRPIEPARVADFCRDCAAPCVTACPAAAILAGGVDLARCGESRHTDPRCATRCDARLACPVGQRSRYEPEALAHHMTSHFRVT